MAPSTEAAVKQKRRQLVADGVHDPFELLAAALIRNEELAAQVAMLQCIVNRGQCHAGAVTTPRPCPPISASSMSRCPPRWSRR
jgi:hypothetical protein